MKLYQRSDLFFKRVFVWFLPGRKHADDEKYYATLLLSG
jgi:hypothetical protein